MRAIAPELAAHLAGEATTLCRCWRATRRDGQVLGFTDHDRDIAFDGTSFVASSGLDAAEGAAKLGFAVGGGEVAGALMQDGLSESDLAAGLWDGASVETFLVNWREPDQRLHLSVGTIGEVRREGGAFTAELRGPAHALDARRGRLFSPTCDARLGDTRCGVDLAIYRRTGTVASVQDRFAFIASGLGDLAGGWLTGGILSWTLGANAGRSADVRLHAAAGGVRIALWQETPRAMAPGDAFEVTPGCDKELATCRAKFANTVNFRGFPHMPGTERALAYPSADDPEHDGGSLQS